MFKRVRWMGAGAVAGAVGTLWVQGRIRRERAAHPSVDLGVRAAQGLRTIGGELRGALADGRDAMAAREAALRAEVDQRVGGSGQADRAPSLRLVPGQDEADPVAAPIDGDGRPAVVRPVPSHRHPAGGDRRRHGSS